MCDAEATVIAEPLRDLIPALKEPDAPKPDMYREAACMMIACQRFITMSVKDSSPCQLKIHHHVSFCSSALMSFTESSRRGTHLRLERDLLGMLMGQRLPEKKRERRPGVRKGRKGVASPFMCVFGSGDLNEPSCMAPGHGKIEASERGLETDNDPDPGRLKKSTRPLAYMLACSLKRTTTA
ncbi:hypothetical protein BCR44DRAFT_33262 [Catenaria anguillulae PL171]|uniref:Uncharacterized protein n=1 Tax=Catenaria anguillulae PL171 TaxID=765915 RepID=A0A1Y2H4W2_9FUNG|nr:hypothetical protein BCR44DRAFT_33262 [Catenaria anguillulae PL171]